MAAARAKGGQGEERSPDRLFAIGVARAFGAAILFSLPLLMTMEMWWLGFYMNRLRLALFMVLIVPLLVGVDHYSGFKETDSWLEDAVDAMVAYGVGIVTAAVILPVLGIVDLQMPLREIVGKVALQAVPASFGAVLAASQLGGGGQGSGEASGGNAGDQKRSGYRVELLFMLAGAVFLAFNVAPTEEMILIAFRMTPWHALLLIALSLMLMHGFVYAMEFRGAPRRRPDASGAALFFRFTVVGYAISLAVSAYVLWTFGRFEDSAIGMYAVETIVLAFPASLGAAAARLIL